VVQQIAIFVVFQLAERTRLFFRIFFEACASRISCAQVETGERLTVKIGCRKVVKTGATSQLIALR